MLNGHNRAAIEQAIREKLDARDETTCRQYAEHAAAWVDLELVEDLCLALITDYAPDWLIDSVSSHSSEILGKALDKFYTHIEDHLEEFVEEEAGNRLKAAEAEAQARADFVAETDAESRRLSR